MPIADTVRDAGDGAICVCEVERTVGQVTNEHHKGSESSHTIQECCRREVTVLFSIMISVEETG